jgi:hypothetical protein
MLIAERDIADGHDQNDDDNERNPSDHTPRGMAAWSTFGGFGGHRRNPRAVLV